jgi:hypothetical protein
MPPSTGRRGSRPSNVRKRPVKEIFCISGPRQTLSPSQVREVFDGDMVSCG